MAEKERQKLELIEFLLKLDRERDRGIFADLRKGASPATERYAWPHIGYYCHLDQEPGRIICQAIAAAYALHPENDDTNYVNLGTSFRNMANLSEEKKASPTFDTYFRRLLGYDTVEEICSCLSRIAKMAKAKGVPLSWEQIYWDMFHWSDEVKRNEVKRKWAAQYWQVPKEMTELSADGELAEVSADGAEEEEES